MGSALFTLEEEKIINEISIESDIDTLRGKLPEGISFNDYISSGALDKGTYFRPGG